MIKHGSIDYLVMEIENYLIFTRVAGCSSEVVVVGVLPSAVLLEYRRRGLLDIPCFVHLLLLLLIVISTLSWVLLLLLLLLLLHVHLDLVLITHLRRRRVSRMDPYWRGSVQRDTLRLLESPIRIMELRFSVLSLRFHLVGVGRALIELLLIELLLLEVLRGRSELCGQARVHHES